MGRRCNGRSQAVQPEKGARFSAVGLRVRPGMLRIFMNARPALRIVAGCALRLRAKISKLDKINEAATPGI
jgi:hypothetical protein